jgi:hypothetical protein
VVLRRKLTVLLMTMMLVVMSAAPAMADKGGDPHGQFAEGSWGYGSSMKKECKERGGIYVKFNRGDHGDHEKLQVCAGP